MCSRPTLGYEKQPHGDTAMCSHPTLGYEKQPHGDTAMCSRPTLGYEKQPHGDTAMCSHPTLGYEKQPHGDTAMCSHPTLGYEKQPHGDTAMLSPYALLYHENQQRLRLPLDLAMINSRQLCCHKPHVLLKIRKIKTFLEILSLRDHVSQSITELANCYFFLNLFFFFCKLGILSLGSDADDFQCYII
jgi:hypothetical protein